MNRRTNGLPGLSQFPFAGADTVAAMLMLVLLVLLVLPADSDGPSSISAGDLSWRSQLRHDSRTFQRSPTN